MKKTFLILLVLVGILAGAAYFSNGDDLQGNLRNTSESTSPAVLNIANAPSLSDEGEVQVRLQASNVEPGKLANIYVRTSVDGTQQDVQKVVMSGGSTMFNGIKLEAGNHEVEICVSKEAFDSGKNQDLQCKKATLKGL
jgi:hypothetical protein